MQQNEIVLNATGVLVNDLISDFTSDINVKVIFIESFPNSNKTFVTLEDVDFIPVRGRDEKRCTVEIKDLEDYLVLGL